MMNEIERALSLLAALDAAVVATCGDPACRLCERKVPAAA
jgi:hypothetical protein